MNKKIVNLFIALVAPCVVNACPCRRTYQPRVVHAMRVDETASYPVAKHPIRPQRVAAAKRKIIY